LNDRSIASDLVLPTVLFVALGAMTWAVRGCSGYGASAGCLFAGVTWGTAWWFLAHEPRFSQSRRYSSGWVILALAVGISLSGNRGWMQWPSFFDGHLLTNSSKGEFVEIPRVYGFLWLFIAGVPWAGIGACLLAWCAPERSLRARDWMLRLSCAFGGAYLAQVIFRHFPDIFLPLHQHLSDRYGDLHENPNLKRLINDNGNAIRHLGFYLGCLGYEAARRDKKNVVLITTVGVLNGLGWAALQNWSWAKRFWPTANFNFWRCWESSAGISIGLAYGVAYYLVNRPADGPLESVRTRPNLERFAAYLGLVLGLGLSIKNGLKGWANIYLGNEDYWNGLLWKIIGPILVGTVMALAFYIWKRPITNDKADLFPNAARIIWIVLIIQNVLAQLVTGPPTVWNEVIFNIYYVVLFLISAVIVHHHAEAVRNRFSAAHEFS
jgi:hypothetical protein